MSLNRVVTNITLVRQGDDLQNGSVAREMTLDAPRETTGWKGSEFRQDE